MQVARGERARGLDVDARLAVGRTSAPRSRPAAPRPPGARPRSVPRRSSASACSSAPKANLAVARPTPQSGVLLKVILYSVRNRPYARRVHAESGPGGALHPGAWPRPKEEVPTWKRVEKPFSSFPTLLPGRVARRLSTRQASGRRTAAGRIEAIVRMAEQNPEDAREALWRLQADWEARKRLERDSRRRADPGGAADRGGDPARTLGAGAHRIRNCGSGCPELMEWLGGAS